MYARLNDPINFEFGLPAFWNPFTFGINPQGNIIPTGGGYISNFNFNNPFDYSNVIPVNPQGQTGNYNTNDIPVNSPDKKEYLDYFAKYPGRLNSIRLAFEKMKKMFIEMTFYRSTMTAYFLNKENLAPGTVAYNTRANELRNLPFQSLLEMRLKDYSIDLFGNTISGDSILNGFDAQTLLTIAGVGLLIFKFLKK